jgi:hypothetical protein
MVNHHTSRPMIFIASFSCFSFSVVMNLMMFMHG